MSGGGHLKRDSAIVALVGASLVAIFALAQLDAVLSLAEKLGAGFLLTLGAALVLMTLLWWQGRMAFQGGRGVLSVLLVLLTGTGASLGLFGPAAFGPRHRASESSSSTPNPGPLTGPLPSSSPTATAALHAPVPSQAPVSVGVSADHPCGPPAQPVLLPRVEVCVVNWCRGEVWADGGRVPGRGEIKIKPRILNNGTSPLNIQISKPSALRLLVPATSGRYPWPAPPRTRAAGDKVLAVTWNGNRYWAVPPNVPGSARPTASGFYSGFATVWDGRLLAPESEYFRAVRYDNTGKAVRSGDLVFELPETHGKLLYSALALIAPKTGQVLAAHSAKDWPTASDPDSF